MAGQVANGSAWILKLHVDRDAITGINCAIQMLTFPRADDAILMAMSAATAFDVIFFPFASSPAAVVMRCSHGGDNNTPRKGPSTKMYLLSPEREGRGAY